MSLILKTLLISRKVDGAVTGEMAGMFFHTWQRVADKCQVVVAIVANLTPVDHQSVSIQTCFDRVAAELGHAFSPHTYLPLK